MTDKTTDPLNDPTEKHVRWQDVYKLDEESFGEGAEKARQALLDIENSELGQQVLQAAKAKLLLDGHPSDRIGVEARTENEGVVYASYIDGDIYVNMSNSYSTIVNSDQKNEVSLRDATPANTLGQTILHETGHFIVGVDFAKVLKANQEVAERIEEGLQNGALTQGERQNFERVNALVHGQLEYLTRNRATDLPFQYSNDVHLDLLDENYPVDIQNNYSSEKDGERSRDHYKVAFEDQSVEEKSRSFDINSLDLGVDEKETMLDFVKVIKPDLKEPKLEDVEPAVYALNESWKKNYDHPKDGVETVAFMLRGHVLEGMELSAEELNLIKEIGDTVGVSVKLQNVDGREEVLLEDPKGSASLSVDVTGLTDDSLKR